MTSKSCDWIRFNEYRAEIARRGMIRCRVSSGSMEPWLKTGQEVAAEHLPSADQLRRFDVIVFHQNDELRCHFVWSVGEPGPRRTIVTRSLRDIFHDDFPIEDSRILGRVAGKLPRLTRARVLFWNALRRTF